MCEKVLGKSPCDFWIVKSLAVQVKVNEMKKDNKLVALTGDVWNTSLSQLSTSDDSWCLINWKNRFDHCVWFINNFFSLFGFACASSFLLYYFLFSFFSSYLIFPFPTSFFCPSLLHSYLFPNSFSLFSSFPFPLHTFLVLTAILPISFLLSLPLSFFPSYFLLSTFLLFFPYYLHCKKKKKLGYLKILSQPAKADFWVFSTYFLGNFLIFFYSVLVLHSYLFLSYFLFPFPFLLSWFLFPHLPTWSNHMWFSVAVQYLESSLLLGRNAYCYDHTSWSLC